MWQVVLVCSDTTANLSLCYKTEQKARDALKRIEPFIGEKGLYEAADDFSNEIRIRGTSISYVLFIDVAQSQRREWEVGQCVERTRAILSKRPAGLSGSPILAA